MPLSNLFQGWHDQLIVTFYCLAKSINFHFNRELMGIFFSSKFWNASTCPPLNQSSKKLSYASALITLASWWLWTHQGHLDAFASFRRLFSCAVHICPSAFSVLNRMHERPIKNYQKPTRTRPLILMFCFVCSLQQAGQFNCSWCVKHFNQLFFLSWTKI